MWAGSKQCPFLLQSVLFDSLTNLHTSLGFGSLPAPSTTPSTTPTGDPFRPYACHICGKRFKLNHHLKQHSRIHTGERPFACNLCGKTFTQQSSYHYHMKKKLCVPPHPGTPEAPGTSPLACGVPPKTTPQPGLEVGVSGLGGGGVVGGGGMLPDLTHQGMSGASSNMSCVGIPTDVMNAAESELGVSGDLMWTQVGLSNN